jgi:hypothetical protein
MKRTNEKGVAMIMALMLLLIMSVMAISLMFISQTETWASMNYRLMDQARDGAEAGINAAANYLINSYTPPASTGSDVLSSYTMTVSPVTYSGSAVVLPSNYPVASVKTAFNSMAQGSLANGNTTVGYNATATLLSQAQFTPWGTSTPTTVQTWKITSDGTVGGLRSADEQVSAILEKQVTPVFTYAAFATSQGCGALSFGGGGTTDSYNSAAALSGGTPVITNGDGDIGTNGNLSTNGSTTTINGSLSTPKTGVGTCGSNNVTAWTDHSGTVTGGLVELPQEVTYPNPTAPNPTPPTSTATLNNNASNCSGVSGSGSSAGCTFGTGTGSGGNGCASGDFCLAPGTCPTTSGGPVTGGGVYGDITVKGTVHLKAGCYNIDSFTENGQGTLIVDSGPVVINIAGSAGGTVLDLTGGGVINNAGWDPSLLQIMYAGTGTVAVKGGANATALLYAPNASFSFNSAGGNWYGAVIVGQMTDMGGATINYDRNLQKTAVTIGNWMLDSFTWSKQ